MAADSYTEQLLRDPIVSFPSATVACFDPTKGDLPRRSLDEARTAQFLGRLAAADVPAVLIAASTGHGHLRTVDELEAWFRVAASVPMGNTKLEALLRPEDGMAANSRLLDVLSETNYPIVFFRPGNDLHANASDREVADQLQPLVAAAAERQLAVGVYSIPDVSGVRLTPDAVAMLLDQPGADHIVAVKVTENHYESSSLKFLEHPRLRRLKIVQGWDTFLARALQDGSRFDDRGRQRCGVTSGPFSFGLYQYLHFLRAAETGDWSEVAVSQEAVTRLFQAMQDHPDKFADLQRAKFIMGLGQPLTGEVSDAQVERVMSALQQLPRADDRQRLARSLDLMNDGPLHERLVQLSDQRG